MTATVEQVPVKLVPFDLEQKRASADQTDPLYPIYEAGGLVLQYTPRITESIKINYNKSSDLVHSNENYYVYQSTDNRTISLSNVTFTSDNAANARMALAAMHFFRAYSYMDFGSGKSGRPPSPMWFSAYGKFAWDRVPVIMTSSDITFDEMIDTVPVDNPGSGTARMSSPSPIAEWVNPDTGVSTSSTSQWVNPDAVSSPWVNPDTGTIGGSELLRQQAAAQVQSSQLSANTTWLPMKLTIGTISLIEQHSPKYWRGFSLDDYRSGKMLASRETNTLTSNPSQGSAAPAALSGTRSASTMGSRPAAAGLPLPSTGSSSANAIDINSYFNTAANVF